MRPKLFQERRDPVERRLSHRSGGRDGHGRQQLAQVGARV
jgi:hypothetical protein